MQSCVKDACADFRLYKDAGGDKNVNLSGDLFLRAYLKCQ